MADWFARTVFLIFGFFFGVSGNYVNQIFLLKINVFAYFPKIPKCYDSEPGTSNWSNDFSLKEIIYCYHCYVDTNKLHKMNVYGKFYLIKFSFIMHMHFHTFTLYPSISNIIEAFWGYEGNGNDFYLIILNICKWTKIKYTM